MTSVAAGSKLIVHGAQGTVVLRSLRTVELEGGWQVSVLGDLAALQSAGIDGGTLPVDFATDQGLLRLEAEVLVGDGSFLLKVPGLRTAALVEQRRENVRAGVRLPLRGTVLSSGVDTRSQAEADLDQGGAQVILDGITETVSAGGISAQLAAGTIVPGARIYLELAMPGGNLAPAVLSTLGQAGTIIRAEFVDISPLDRERLVRLVFSQQRAELAGRRHVSR